MCFSNLCCGKGLQGEGGKILSPENGVHCKDFRSLFSRLASVSIQSSFKPFSGLTSMRTPVVFNVVHRKALPKFNRLCVGSTFRGHV